MLGSRWRISLVLLISLVIRLAWGLTRPDELSPNLPDQIEYHEIACHVVVGDGLRFFDERFGQEEVAFRAPGYPLFLALFGAQPRLVWIGQAIVDTSTVLAIYLLARRWLDERAALLAAALVGLNPFLIFFSSVMLSETLFTAAVAWGISLTARKQRAGVLLLALAVLVRPAAMALPALVYAIAGLPSWRGAIRGLLIGAAASFLVLLPWAYRNSVVLHEWIWTTTNAGQTTYDGFRDGATGSSDLGELPHMAELSELCETARDRYLGYLGRRAMEGDWPRSLALAQKKIARTWSPVPLSDEYGSARNRVIAITYAVPVFVLVVIGLFRRALPWPIKSLCLLPALYFTAGAAITVGSLRYRVPAEPPMIVIAAGALSRKAEVRIQRAE